MYSESYFPYNGDRSRDFPWANLGPVIGPCFSPIESEIPKFFNKFPLLMSEFVLHFGENCMKIAPKLIIEVTGLW